MEGAAHQHHVFNLALPLELCSQVKSQNGPKVAWLGAGHKWGRKVKTEQHLPCGLLLLSSAKECSFSNSCFFAKGFFCKCTLKKLLMKQFQQHNRWHQEEVKYIYITVSVLCFCLSALVTARPACRRNTTILHWAAQMLSFLRHTGTAVFPCKRVVCVDTCKKEGFVCCCCCCKTNATKKKKERPQTKQTNCVGCRTLLIPVQNVAVYPGWMAALWKSNSMHFAVCISLFSKLGAGRRAVQVATFLHQCLSKWAASEELFFQKAPVWGWREKKVP